MRGKLMVKTKRKQRSYSAHQYIYEVLRNSGFFIGSHGNDKLPVWYKQISKDVMYQDYVVWCEKRSKQLLNKTVFCKVVNMLIVSVEEVRPYVNGVRQRCYKFPTLRQAQEDFGKASKVEPEYVFSNYRIATVPLELLQEYSMQ